MVKRDQSFPDPSQVTDEKQFTYQALVASVFKKVIAEILMQEEFTQDSVDKLRAKEQGEVEKNPFAIGKE